MKGFENKLNLKKDYAKNIFEGFDKKLENRLAQKKKDSYCKRVKFELKSNHTLHFENNRGRGQLMIQ